MGGGLLCLGEMIARLVFGLMMMLALTPGLAGAGMESYFSNEVAEIAAACRGDFRSLAEWQARRPELRREAAEMLGLDPLPQRTDLKPIITGKIEREDFTVEKVAFQSMPRLYVTGNLYLPKPGRGRAPAILYLCGHSAVVTNGISCGNKTAYQQHGIWLARNGYVCLVIDTLEQGEIQGRHKGTHSLGMWWWNTRGYTPAGVETWNAMRALDYLAGRPEVDPERLGVTGRSGGGAYSWFLAALDERVKVIAPVAGMADLESYEGGTVDRHCDCMFLVNTYRWDYPLLAALCAPRPLLLGNTDADEYFPLDGVLRTHDVIKRVYDLYGAGTNFGLVIAPGPHRDIPDLQVPVLRWFNIHLKHEDPAIQTAAVKMFAPQELRVFGSLPADQVNTSIEQSFVPTAPTPAIPRTAAEWEQMRAKWMEQLRSKCFAGWPAHAEAARLRLVQSKNTGAGSISEFDLESQPGVRLKLYQTQPRGISPGGRVTLRLEEPGVPPPVSVQNTNSAVFYPRGDERNKGQRRRYMLIGQTLDSMRVWDIRRALEALGKTPVVIEAKGDLGVDALYASLFETNVAGLELRQIPSSHREGPDYLNVLRVMDIPEAMAMAAEYCPVRLLPASSNGWDFLRAVSASPAAQVKLEWENK